MNPAPHGEIVHQRFESLRGKDPVKITATHHSISQGKLLMVERRTLKAPAPLSEGIWLEWTSEFSAAKEPVTLSAAPTFRQPFHIEPGGQPLRLTWAVLAYPDQPNAEVLNRLHKRFGARREGKYRLLTRAAQPELPSRDWAPSGQGAVGTVIS